MGVDAYDRSLDENLLVSELAVVVIYASPSPSDFEPLLQSHPEG